MCCKSDIGIFADSVHASCTEPIWAHLDHGQSKYPISKNVGHFRHLFYKMLCRPGICVHETLSPEQAHRALSNVVKLSGVYQFEIFRFSDFTSTVSNALHIMRKFRVKVPLLNDNTLKKFLMQYCLIKLSEVLQSILNTCYTRNKESFYWAHKP